MRTKSHNQSVIDGIIGYSNKGISYSNRVYIVNELVDHFQERDSGFDLDYTISNMGMDEHRKEIANVLVEIVLGSEWSEVKGNPDEDKYILNRSHRQRLMDEILSEVSEALGESHDFYKNAENFIMYGISREDIASDDRLSAKFAELNESIELFDIGEEDKKKLVLSIFEITTKLQRSARPYTAAELRPW